MPERTLVEAFVAQVLSGDHVGAIRDWYADDASMQENQGRPRIGRKTLMDQETETMARMQQVVTELLSPPLVDGDRVVINWRFSFLPKLGAAHVLDELALQTWSGGKIVAEQFFYDPAQMKR